MKIVTLIENVSNNPNLIGEHGLSLYVEKGDRRYLIDTGETSQFIQNAQVLGIDLTRLDSVIISHNHYDHIGGLDALFSINKDVKVYIKSAARSLFYAYRDNEDEEYIGQRPGLFEDYPERFIFIDESCQLAPDVTLLSNESMDKGYFCQDNQLLERREGKFILDAFKHELFIVLEEEDGIVIISSCSHNGIVNILKTVKKRYPHQRITHVVGGLHMMATDSVNGLNCSENYVLDVGDRLGELGVEKAYIGHCTGSKAFSLLSGVLGEKVRSLRTGTVIVTSNE